MNARRVLTTLAGVVVLFAGWAIPAPAQPFRLGIHYTETRFHRARGLGVDRVDGGQLGDRLRLKRWDFLYRLKLTRDGETIVDMRVQTGLDLSAVLARARNGDTITATFSRNGGHWYRTSAPVGYGYGAGIEEIQRPADPDLGD